MLPYITSLACWCITAALVWAAWSPTVDDRIVVKLGLGMQALGFSVLGYKLWNGIDAWEIEAVTRALLLVATGFGVIVGGFALRVKQAGHAQRRITDWAALEETRPMDDQDLRHVTGGRG